MIDLHDLSHVTKAALAEELRSTRVDLSHAVEEMRKVDRQNGNLQRDLCDANEKLSDTKQLLDLTREHKIRAEAARDLLRDILESLHTKIVEEIS